MPSGLRSLGRKIMKTLALFAGCGGMDLGARTAGAEIIYANEIDLDACMTLGKYFRRTRIDQRNIADVEKFPKADLVIGGYPCQSFSMGGNRDPEKDARTYLYLQFARCLELVQPMYFVAENVSGLKRLQGGTFLEEQHRVLSQAGKRGYRISVQEVDAKNYGVPQTRRRVLLVGVRRDLDRSFLFPEPTHGRATTRAPHLVPFTSHGEVIRDLPLWPKGEFYERPHDPEGHFSWYYMSRNRKAPWDGPSYTIVANWRHVTLHPASSVMTLTWSNLADGWKQRWDFSGEYEHVKKDPKRPVLEEPRRLSWRECARIQTFPKDFEPVGDVESKFTQIGNAVPPLLAKIITHHLLSGEGLVRPSEAAAFMTRQPTRKASPENRQLLLW
jgi:DNA (cytosine-5)-methyltransferase 1